MSLGALKSCQWRDKKSANAREHSPAREAHAFPGDGNPKKQPRYLD
jgi:hypothetical protein